MSCTWCIHKNSSCQKKNVVWVKSFLFLILSLSYPTNSLLFTKDRTNYTQDMLLILSCDGLDFPNYESVTHIHTCTLLLIIDPLKRLALLSNHSITSYYRATNSSMKHLASLESHSMHSEKTCSFYLITDML